MGHRYIGSKSSLVDVIIREVSRILPHGGHVADPMCGTAIVSEALRGRGYCVTAADIMTYSFHHARVALLISEPPKFVNADEFLEANSNKSGRPRLIPLNRYERVLESLSSVQPERGYFWKEFSSDGDPAESDTPRNYFSPYNAMMIDAIRRTIRELRSSRKITELEHSLLIHDLIMATNDVANIAGTYGHYLSRLRGRANEEIRLTPSSFMTPRNDCVDHSVLHGYVEELAAEISCDLCYLDPPYMKRQYAANYHILETIARGDNPRAIGKSGLRPWRDQYSNFCTRTRSADSFRQVIETMECDDFLISYSEDGLLGEHELNSILEEYGEVSWIKFKNKRFRSNDSDLPHELHEYLIHLTVR